MHPNADAPRGRFCCPICQFREIAVRSSDGRASHEVTPTRRRSSMPTEQQRASMQTVDVPGRRRWLLWGERTREFHLQPLAAQADGGAETLCGRPIEPDSRSVIAPDNYVCPDCVGAARAQARLS
jgi:hypothetical protein